MFIRDGRKRLSFTLVDREDINGQNLGLLVQRIQSRHSEMINMFRFESRACNLYNETIPQAMSCQYIFHWESHNWKN